MKKKEKIQHLKTLLENIKLAQDRGGRVGFCLCLPWRVNISEFPELLAYEPKDHADETFWFPRKDYQTRIDIVEKVIKELEDSIPWYQKLFL